MEAHFYRNHPLLFFQFLIMRQFYTHFACFMAPSTVLKSAPQSSTRQWKCTFWRKSHWASQKSSVSNLNIDNEVNILVSQWTTNAKRTSGLTLAVNVVYPLFCKSFQVPARPDSLCFRGFPVIQYVRNCIYRERPSIYCTVRLSDCFLTIKMKWVKCAARFIPAEVCPPDLSGFFWRGPLQESVQILCCLCSVAALACLQLCLQVHGVEQGRVHLWHLQNTQHVINQLLG